MIQDGEFWLVLAASVLVFWLLPKHFRHVFLAMVSVAYIASLQWQWAAVLLGWSILFYWLAPITAVARMSPANRQSQRLGRDGRRWILSLLIFAIVGYLAWFKYLQNTPQIRSWIFGQDFSARPIKLVIPLGISYFTFKFIHYAVEVARGNIKDRSFWQFLSYIFLFPTFSAGPIERFDHYLANQQSDFSGQAMVEGITRISHGLIKKFVGAELILGHAYATVTSNTFLAHYGARSTWNFWGFAITTYLWVYMDFSGYSDIAIGASRLFGLRIMENFNFPMVAPNISDFWRRWHMTLAGWCQTYVYMPVLAWLRSPYIALYTTFIVIGLWHAASGAYLFWGCYHATGIAIYQLWAKFKRRKKWKSFEQRPWKYAGIPVTFLFVSAGEICTLGGAQTGRDALRILGKLFFIQIHRA